MDNPKLILFVALGVVAVIYLAVWRRALIAGRARDNGAEMPGPTEVAIGFGTNFFDTLGIGSYAPTTALFRFFRLVPDEKIPGTMTLGHTLPTIVQSFIFIAIVNVNFATLVLLIGASIVGAWLGAGVVAKWPRRNIQIGMGLALVAAAVLFTMANLGIVAAGGTALGLTGTRLRWRRPPRKSPFPWVTLRAEIQPRAAPASTSLAWCLLRSMRERPISPATV